MSLLHRRQRIGIGHLLMRKEEHNTYELPDQLRRFVISPTGTNLVQRRFRNSFPHPEPIQVGITLRPPRAAFVEQHEPWT